MVSMMTWAMPRTSSSICRSALDGGRDAAVVGLQRMAVAGLAEAPDERLVGRLQEEDLGSDVAALERADAPHQAPAGALPERMSSTSATRWYRSGSLATSSARSASRSEGTLSTTV